MTLSTRRTFLRSAAIAVAAQLTASAITTRVMPIAKGWFEKLIRAMCEDIPHPIDA